MSGLCCVKIMSFWGHKQCIKFTKMHYFCLQDQHFCLDASHFYLQKPKIFWGRGCAGRGPLDRSSHFKTWIRHMYQLLLHIIEWYERCSSPHYCSSSYTTRTRHDLANDSSSAHAAYSADTSLTGVRVVVSGVTYPPGMTPEWKKLWLNLQRIVEKQGRVGKKGMG